MTQELHSHHNQAQLTTPDGQPAYSVNMEAPFPAQESHSLQHHQLAALGEQLARRHFEQEGYRILHCNWRAGRRGELDLIAQDHSGLLIFVEVKTRLVGQPEPGFDWPGFDAIHYRKQKQLISLARMYTTHNATADTPCRFDVFVVWYPADCPPDKLTKQKPQIFHIPDAFSL